MALLLGLRCQSSGRRSIQCVNTDIIEVVSHQNLWGPTQLRPDAISFQWLTNNTDLDMRRKRHSRVYAVLVCVFIMLAKKLKPADI